MDFSGAHVFEDPHPCNCRLISQDNLRAALAEGATTSDLDLYNAALAHRQNDIASGRGGRITGNEGAGPLGYNCGTCRYLFQEAVMAAEFIAPARQVIPIAIDRAAPSQK